MNRRDQNIPLIDDTARSDTEREGGLDWADGGGTIHSFHRLSALHEPDFFIKHSRLSSDDNVRSVVHQYARNGKLKELEESVKNHPAVVNNIDQDGFTALHYACRYGHAKIVSFLLGSGAQPNLINNDGLTALHIIAKYGRDERYRSSPIRDSPSDSEEKESTTRKIIELLIKDNARVNDQDDYGLTPLHYTAMKGNLTAAQALLDFGNKYREGNDKINLEITEMHSMTPLLTACVYGVEDIVVLLLKENASMIYDAKDDDEKDDVKGLRTKNTAFHIAAQHGHAKILNTLLQHAEEAKIDPKEWLTKTNHENKTPLYLAAEGNHPLTTTEILKIQGKPSMLGKEKYLIHITAERGFLQVLQILVENGADYKILDDEERLPIHLAAIHNHSTIVEYLLDQDDSLMEAKDERGFTPLLLAVSYHDSVDVVKVLIERGADCRVVDYEGRTIVFIAAKCNSRKCLQYILEMIEERKKNRKTKKMGMASLRVASAVTSLDDMVNQQDHAQDAPMHIVCANGYLEICQLLFKHEALIDILNEDEETPIHSASAFGRTDILRQLVEWDRRLVTAKDERGYTPLHLAAARGHDAAVEVLLDAGSDMESRNATDETPLQLAVANNMLDTLRILVNRRAEIERNDNSLSPLLVAARNGNDEIVRFLLHGRRCSVLKTNERGQTALNIAIEMKHREVVRALIESDDWFELMKPRDIIRVEDDSKIRLRQTPLRDLLANFPDLVSSVFDKLITRRGDDPSNYNFVIEYDFTLIDDTFMMPNYEGTKLIGLDDPWQDSADNFGQEGTKLKQEAQTYTPNHDIIYKNHPLKLIANSEKLTLLKHELVDQLIKYKWNSVGRRVYYPALFIYTFFIVLYTVFIGFTPAPYNVFDKNQGKIVDISEQLDNMNGTCSEVSVDQYPWMEVIRCMIIVLASGEIVKEVYQLYTRRLAYLSLENFVEIFLYCSAIVTVLNFSDCSRLTGVPMTWQWLLAALCSFLCWMNLLMLIRKLPMFGIYVVMFFDILRTFFKFFIVFALFVVAFSIAFFVILQNRPEFSTPWSSIIKTTVMMIGEFEFTAIFHGDIEQHEERIFGQEIAYPLFLAFCIIMTILLMNLLVGLAVDDIKAVQEKADLRRKVMMVDIVLQIETTMPWLRRKKAIGIYRIFKNHRSWMKTIRNKFGFMSGQEEADIPIRSEEEELMAILRDELRRQESQIKNLQENIDYIYEKELGLESMMKALLKHNNIDHQKN